MQTLKLKPVIELLNIIPAGIDIAKGTRDMFNKLNNALSTSFKFSKKHAVLSGIVFGSVLNKLPSETAKSIFEQVTLVNAIIIYLDEAIESKTLNGPNHFLNALNNIVGPNISGRLSEGINSVIEAMIKEEGLKTTGESIPIDYDKYMNIVVTSNGMQLFALAIAEVSREEYDESFVNLANKILRILADIIYVSSKDIQDRGNLAVRYSEDRELANIDSARIALLKELEDLKEGLKILYDKLESKVPVHVEFLMKCVDQFSLFQRLMNRNLVKSLKPASQ